MSLSWKIITLRLYIVQPAAVSSQAVFPLTVLKLHGYLVGHDDVTMICVTDLDVTSPIFRFAVFRIQLFIFCCNDDSVAPLCPM